MLQRVLESTECCECWNIKINKNRIQAICFSRGNGQVESHLTLQELNIAFVNQVKYVCVIFGENYMYIYIYKCRRQGLQIIYECTPY
jgi:hypothetical protein